MKTPPKERSGNWRESIPSRVLDDFDEPSPGWDWSMKGDYIVVRLFDEGIEMERLVAKIVRKRIVQI